MGGVPTEVFYNFRIIWAWNAVFLKTIFFTYENNFLFYQFRDMYVITFHSMSLGKRSWLITPFQLLMASSKSISGLQITHKPREPVNDVTNCQHFTRGIPGTNFKFMPYMKVEIQRVGEHVCPTPCALTIVEKRCTLEGLVP